MFRGRFVSTPQCVHIVVRRYGIDAEYNRNVADRRQAICIAHVTSTCASLEVSTEICPLHVGYGLADHPRPIGRAQCSPRQIYGLLQYCKPSWTWLGLKFCLTSLHRVLDRRKHFGENWTRIHLDVVGGHTKYHRIHVPWSRYQAMEDETEKCISLFRLTHA